MGSRSGRFLHRSPPGRNTAGEGTESRVSRLTERTVRVPAGRLRARSSRSRQSVGVDVHSYITNDQLRQAPNDFVRLKVDVIFVGVPFAAMAAKQATVDIPIVCGSCGDPVEDGLAASLARPGGNVTGLASLSAELIEKRVELLKELFPSVSRLAVFLYPVNPGTRAALSVLDTVGRTLRIELQPVEIRGAGDFEDAFRAVATSGAGGVVLQDDPLTRSARTQIAQLALKHRSRYPPAYRRLPSPVPSSRTGPIAWTCTGEPPRWLTASSRGPSPRTYRSNRPRSSSW